jgi:Heterokaryon incompatibility protein (HET)
MAYFILPIRLFWQSFCDAAGIEKSPRDELIQALLYGDPVLAIPGASLPPNTKFFTYEPLNQHRGPTIRLLELLPGPNDAVSCIIRHVPLADNPRYEALSYYWGAPPHRTESILCNDARVDITLNLHVALLRLRRPLGSRLLWIDAICINQDEKDERAIDERNQQVRMMADIYRKAQQVIIWLGEEDYDSLVGFALVPKLVKAFQELQRPLEIGRYAPAFLIKHGLPPPLHPWYRGFFRIFERPWFRRVWVIQELAACSNSVVQCGGKQYQWEHLMLSIMFLFQMTQVWRLRLSEVMALNCARQHVIDKVPNELLRLALRHRQSEATRAQDKIFALYGLSNDADALGMEPNYRIEVDQLYKNFAIAVLERDRGLDLFAFSKSLDNANQSHLPSWIPDWRRSDSTVACTIRRLESIKPPDLDWQAARDTVTQPTYSRDRNSIRLEGIILGAVAETSTIYPIFTLKPKAASATASYREICDIIRGLENWEKVAQLRSNHTYITGESKEDAFWQTLIAGHSIPGPFEGIQAEWKAWRKGLSRSSLPLMIDADSSKAKAALAITGLKFKTVAKTLKATVASPNVRGRLFGMWTEVAINRRMIRTKGGHIGLAPGLTREGDIVAILQGGKMPLVLRPKGSSYELIGECYVHGVMHGEAFHQQDCRPVWLV